MLDFLDDQTKANGILGLMAAGYWGNVLLIKSNSYGLAGPVFSVIPVYFEAFQEILPIAGALQIILGLGILALLILGIMGRSFAYLIAIGIIALDLIGSLASFWLLGSTAVIPVLFKIVIELGMMWHLFLTFRDYHSPSNY